MYQHKRDEARHEAGHAVVAALLGFTVGEVSIDPPECDTGRTYIDGALMVQRFTGRLTPSGKVMVAMMYAAGAVAQRTENPWVVLETRALADLASLRELFDDTALTEIMYEVLRVLLREDVRPLHEALVERLLCEGTVGDPGVPPDPHLADPSTWTSFASRLTLTHT